jgi:fumarylacetoacetase
VIIEVVTLSAAYAIQALVNARIAGVQCPHTEHTLYEMSLKSWWPIPRGSPFSLANIPFGIISTSLAPKPRPAVAIGDHALDLEAFAAGNGFAACSIIQPHQSVFSESTLNAFAALGQPVHSVVRKYIQSVFSDETPYPNVLKSNATLQQRVLVPLKDARTHLPMQIGDYTDFYAGRNHAFNVGMMFRGKENALQPNYNHLPVGYHGRASSVVVSGTPIRRPQGQILEHPTATPKVPTFAACRKLDIELELGAFICKGNPRGEPIPIGDAEEYLFGVVLMNDWSARDIQAWEYVPLGPFNAKNFGTTISPWVVLVDALEPFRMEGLPYENELLPYLREKRENNMYDIQLEVELKRKSFTSLALNSAPVA